MEPPSAEITRISYKHLLTVRMPPVVIIDDQRQAQCSCFVDGPSFDPRECIIYFVVYYRSRVHRIGGKSGIYAIRAAHAHFITAYGEQIEKVLVNEDNISAIHLANEPMNSTGSKHINIRNPLSFDVVRKDDVSMMPFETQLEYTNTVIMAHQEKRW